MKPKFLLALFLLCAHLLSYSQVSFQAGYFINESNQKTSCLIKNMDWKDNPDVFEYKLTEDGKVYKASKDSIQEFGIANTQKYIRAVVQVDRSSDNINSLDEQRSPVFKEEQVLLKVLLEGEFSLYQYVDKSLYRYFFSAGDAAIEPLIYKRYMKDGAVAYNKYYIQQISNLTFDYPALSVPTLTNVSYAQKELKRVFTSLNESVQAPVVSYTEKQQQKLLHLTVRPGMQYSNLTIYSGEAYIGTIEMDPAYHFRLGVEAEILLPFNHQKWSVFMEPTFMLYHATKTQEVAALYDRMIAVNVDYNVVEVPLGIRYYAYLNKESRLFVNAAIVMAQSVSSSTNINRLNGEELYAFEPHFDINYVFGLGYSYKNRFSAELRYAGPRNLFDKALQWSSDLTSLSLMVGYTFF